MSDNTLIRKKPFYLLMGVELWERYSYYSMQFLLVLYTSAALNQGGLGWSKANALELVGIYGAAVFILPIFGGILADKFVGQKTSALIGALLMALGHFTLSFKSGFAFYFALVLLAVGSGFFKSCIPAMIAQIFSKNEVLKANAYSTFYMAVNMGAMIAGVTTGLISQYWGYHPAFAVAGFGMLIGFLILVAGQKFGILQGIGDKPETLSNQAANQKVSIRTALAESPLARKKYRIYVFLTVMFLLQYCLYFVVTNGPLTLYLQSNANRTIGSFEVPVTWFQSLDSISTVVAAFSLNLFFLALARRKIIIPVLQKVGFGLILLGLTFLLITYAAWAVTSTPGVLVSMWPFVLFFILSNYATMFISPTVLFASNDLVPKGTESFHTAIYYVMIGIASYVANKIGVLIFTVGAFEVFGCIAIAMIILGLTHFMVAPRANRSLDRNDTLSPSTTFK